MNRKEKLAVYTTSALMFMAVIHAGYSLRSINLAYWNKIVQSGLFDFRFLIHIGLVLLTTFYAAKVLSESHRIMNISLLRFIPAMKWVSNIAFVPLRLHWSFASTYVLLLYFSLPAFAATEEYLFRTHVVSFKSAVVVTIVFGLIHLLVGSTLAVSIAVMIPGALFAYVYTQLGLHQAAYYHLMYNIFAVTLGTTVLVMAMRKTKVALAES